MVMLASFPAASTALIVCSVSAGETVSVPSAVSDTGVPFTVTCIRFASLIVNVDAQFLTQGLGSNGWYRANATLKAPDGFYIAFTNDRGSFGANKQIVITEEGSYTMKYYLMNI